MNLYFHSAAEAELTDAALFYADVRQTLAHSFITAVEHATDLIQERPLIGELVAADNIRRVRVQRFPYSIIYRVLSDRIRVLAVSHHRRQPNHWVGRQ